MFFLFSYIVVLIQTLEESLLASDFDGCHGKWGQENSVFHHNSGTGEHPMKFPD